MFRLIEFLFFRWKREVQVRGEETWIRNISGVNIEGSTYRRVFIDYKFTNKFDGSVKIKRKYLN